MKSAPPLLALLGILLAACVFAAPSGDAQKLFKDGNYQEALDAFQKVLDDPSTEPEPWVRSFQRALNCYQKLNRVDQIDSFREALLSRENPDWQVLAAVAKSYLQQVHYGYRIAGEFRRGQHRGGGKIVNASARDRVRAIQLYQRAVEKVEKDSAEQKPTELLDAYASAVLYGNNYREAWRLQILTKLDELPDYEEGWGYHSGQLQGAPVDADDQPIFYDIPPTWEDAKSDGERWRWLLEKSVQWDPKYRNQERIIRARFLQSQFGTQTLANYGWWFSRQV